MEAFQSHFDFGSSKAKNNFKVMEKLCHDLGDELKRSTIQGKEKYIERHIERGKLLPRERVELLLDPGSPFLELMPLAGVGQEEMTNGGSLIVGMGIVEGVLCLINAIIFVSILDSTKDSLLSLKIIFIFSLLHNCIKRLSSPCIELIFKNPIFLYNDFL